jgi:integrase
MLTHAKARGWIVSVPDIPRQKEGEHRIRWVSDEEEAALVSFLERTGKKAAAEFFTLAMDTGLRKSELLRLEFKDAADGWVRVWGAESKGGYSRSVPMTSRVAEIVADRKAAAAPGDRRVFSDLNVDAVDWAWECARTELKLTDDKEFVIHCLRHTFCSRLAQRGAELTDIKEMAGHRSIATTLRYAHLMPKRLQQVVGLLEPDGTGTPKSLTGLQPKSVTKVVTKTG